MTSKQKTGYETIVLGDMSERAATSVWENVAGLGRDYYGQASAPTSDRELFEHSLVDAEERYMGDYHTDKFDKYLGKGKTLRLNKRKYLPSKYRTAKSVAANCLEHGVKMHDAAGNVLAKSWCEKLIKEAKRTNVMHVSVISDTLEKSPEMKAIQHKNRLLDLVGDIDDAHREYILTEIQISYGRGDEST